MPRPLPDPIERAARPFLPKLLKLAAEQGRFPADYFLLIGKYDPSSGAIIPRSLAGDVVALAKTDARRRKYERLIASPCEPNDLLVLVTAGDHVEGHWMRVPAVVPTPSAAAAPALTPEGEAYLKRHLDGIVSAVRKKGGRMGDWCAVFLALDSAPVVLRRTQAVAPLTEAGASDELLRELAKPAPDDELFFISPGSDTFAWCRLTTSATTDGDASHDGMMRVAHRLVRECKESLESLGKKPCEYIAYVRWPPADGSKAQPIVCPRSAIHEELRALEGTKKLEQILAYLEDPFDGMTLFIDAADREDILITYKDDGELEAEANAILAEADLGFLPPGPP